MPSLKGRDVISALELTREEVEHLYAVADKLKQAFEEFGSLDIARNKIMITAFFEPSTRTKISFQMAMARLGGTVVDFLASTSSLAKGETDYDTIRILDGYDPDIIVIRQKKPGFPAEVAPWVKAPILNAGDGYNEHPTQALLDVYTISRELGKVDGVHVAIMGDLKYGRTPSSLSYLLSKFNDVTIYYVAPEPLQIREEVLKNIEGKVRYELLNDIRELKGKPVDVIYVTRLQKERLPDPGMYEKLKGAYKVDAALLKNLFGENIPIIMHPLPRTWELDTSVDPLPQAKYFQQAKNGLYVRAALIKEVLGL
jgi:aspartate carbamoyltransferase catalytic subunit